MNHKVLKLSFKKSYELMQYLNTRDDLSLELNNKKTMVICYDANNEIIFEYRYPITFPVAGDNDVLAGYVDKIKDIPLPYLIILVQAGSSALGYFENGNLVHHKVIKKYMVRKKQGKAQLTHLKSKGKSRAGSRIRLANTITFFEEINSKLNDWQKTATAQRVLYSCPVRLWGMVFKSNVKTPFDKKDPRLRKIPLDVNIPDLEELQRVNRFALSGFITFYQEFTDWEFA